MVSHFHRFLITDDIFSNCFALCRVFWGVKGMKPPHFARLCKTSLIVIVLIPGHLVRDLGIHKTSIGHKTAKFQPAPSLSLFYYTPSFALLLERVHHITFTIIIQFYIMFVESEENRKIDCTAH